MPRGSYVHEREPFAGPTHACDPQTDREHDARGERNGARTTLHGAPPPWRTRKTVSMPAAKNVSVAPIDRTESRLMPHTPWPLVQPPESLVPTPTKRPPATVAPVEPG